MLSCQQNLLASRNINQLPCLLGQACEVYCADCKTETENLCIKVSICFLFKLFFCLNSGIVSTFDNSFENLNRNPLLKETAEIMPNLMIQCLR